jgi:hypothetical protein
LHISLKIPKEFTKVEIGNDMGIYPVLEILSPFGAPDKAILDSKIS